MPNRQTVLKFSEILASTPTSYKEDELEQKNLHLNLLHKPLRNPTFHINCCKDPLQTMGNSTLGNQLPKVV